MEEINNIKETLRKTIKNVGGDSISLKYRDKKNEETLIITLHNYIDEE